MAKSWAGNLYRWDFELPSSDFQFRLNIVPSYTGFYFPNSNVVVGDNVAIRDFRMNWEYDKYPIGIINPTLEITFDLNYCSDNVQDLLIYPFETSAFTPTQWSGTVASENINFTFGNFYELQMKRKTDISYTTIYYGMTSTSEAELQDNTIKVTVESAGKMITSIITDSHLSKIWTLGTGTSISSYLDYGYKKSGGAKSNYAIKNLQDNYKLWLHSLSDFNDYIESLCSQLIAEITRDYITTFDVSLFSTFVTGFAKQTYNGAVLPKGSAISSASELFIPTHLVDEDYADRNTSTVYDKVKLNATGGIFYLFKNNYDTLWDFITEYAQASMLKFTNFINISASTMTQATSLTLNNIYELKPSVNYNILNSVSSQYLEESGQNTKEWKSVSQANKNDNSYNLVHFFSSKVFVPEQKAYARNENSNEVFSISTQVDNAKLFYYDSSPTSSYGALTKTNQYIKVHDHYTVSLGNSKTISDYAVDTDYTFESNIVNNGVYIGNIEAYTTNNAQMTAQAMRGIFSNIYQTGIEFSVFLDDLKFTFGALELPLVFYPIIADVEYDFTNVNSRFSLYPTNHLLTKCEFDFVNYTSRFTAISRNW